MRINKLKNSKLFYILLAIFITTVFAYGLTLDMYFWKDDFALMIKARYPLQQVGYYAEGYRGGAGGGYSYIPLIFEALFPLFGMNPIPYFGFGILFYFAAAIAVYFLALNILKNRVQALCAALIFAAGYVGADSVYGLTNSYQTSWVIIFTSLVLVFLFKYYEQKKILYYILSFFIFCLCLITGFVRAHGVIIVVFAAGLLLIKHFRFKEVGKFILLLVPYSIFFYTIYLNTPAGGANRARFFTDILQGNYAFFIKSIATFSGVFFPYAFIQYLANFLTQIFQKPYEVEFINVMLGIAFIIFNIILLFLVKDARKKKILSFSLLFVVGNYIAVFYIGAAASSLISTHRYLTIPFVGASLYLVTLFSLIKQKRIFYGLVGIVVVINILLVNLYSIESINTRTRPQKKFYDQVTSYLPTMAKGTVLYYDVSNQYQSPGKFGNIFGVGMAGGSPEVSSHYDIDRYDISSFYTYADFIAGIADNKSLKYTYTFYYENENLINTTATMKKLLQQKVHTDLSAKTYTITSQKGTEQNTPWPEQVLELPLQKSISSLTDNMLRFNLIITPLLLTESSFSSKETTDNAKYFSYLQDRKQLRQMTNAAVGSFYQQQRAENLVDDNKETYWMGARGVWGAIVDKTTDEKEYIQLSLPAPRAIGGILFTNGSEVRTPRKYVIYAYIDDAWKKIKTVTGPARSSNELFFESIPTQVTNKLRIEILQTTGNDSPQLAEVELIPAEYATIDFTRAFSLQKNPLIAVNSFVDYQSLLTTYNTFGYFTVSYYSNKDIAYVNTPITVPIKGLYQPFTYEVIIPAGGTQLKNIRIQNLWLPATYVFSDFAIENMTLKEEKFLHKRSEK